jgi:hypothetical protein
MVVLQENESVLREFEEGGGVFFNTKKQSFGVVC